MKLKRFLLRYFPPGITLEYESAGELKQKTIDLLELTVETDVEVLLNQILKQVSFDSLPRQMSPALCTCESKSRASLEGEFFEPSGRSFGESVGSSTTFFTACTPTQACWVPFEPCLAFCTA